MVKNKQLFKSFAACHGSYLVDNELIGDPLDVAMLNFSNYTINNSDDPQIKFIAHSPTTNTTLFVHKIFDFESEL